MISSHLQHFAEDLERDQHFYAAAQIAELDDACIAIGAILDSLRPRYDPDPQPYDPFTDDDH